MLDTDLIRRSADLVAIARQYGMPVHKSGFQFTAPCPFHQEKTPGAFVIHPRKQVFTCHSCQVSGDVFTLVKYMESLPDFPSTARRVAELAGVPLTDEPWTKEQRRQYAIQRAQAQQVAIEAAQFWRDIRFHLSRLVAETFVLDRLATQWCREHWDDPGFDTAADERAWIIFTCLVPAAEVIEHQIERIDAAKPESLVQVYLEYRADHPSVVHKMQARRDADLRFGAAIIAMLASSKASSTITHSC